MNRVDASTVVYVGCPADEKPCVHAELDAANLSVVWADEASAADDLPRKNVPVVLDLSRGAAALQIARDMFAHSTTVAVFAVADARRPDLTTEAVLAGVADVFARPLGGRIVATALAHEFERGGAAKSHATAHEHLYAHSAAMRDVMVQIARAGAARTGVLVGGEDGSGRRIAARAIHAADGDISRPFVVVNCAAHQAEDLDAVMFGSASPASARKSKGGDRADDPSRGLIRVSRDSRLYEARGGTLYIQHLPESPARSQAKLARVLRDREALVERGTVVDMDVRPIAAVGADFDEAVRDGRVREDLFKRLDGIRIELPPLRNRREDIPVLANRFLREICAIERIPPKCLSRPALALLGALPWRGNAPELRSVLQNVVNGHHGGRNIGIEDVLPCVRLDGGPSALPKTGTLKQARAEFEREYISAVVERHNGSISQAAHALGIQRTNLYRKLRSLHIPSARKPSSR